eukprot:225977_1
MALMAAKLINHFSEDIRTKSVRGGFLIQQGFKKIENRKKRLGKEFHNTWIALHVSKTFKTTEENFAHKYLQNHTQLLDSNACHSKQKTMTTLWGSRIKLNNRQKITNLIQSQLKPQMGHIIAFIMISKCASSEEGHAIDSTYCDQPFHAQSHWVISDLIPLTKKEYCATRGHMGCARISDRSVNKLLSNILAKKLQQREEIKHQKQTQNAMKSTSNSQCDEDEDIIDIMADLDNAISQNESISESPAIDTHSGKKRKHEEMDPCPPAKRLKTNDAQKTLSKLQLNATNTNVKNDGFRKISRDNSLSKMKQNANQSIEMGDVEIGSDIDGDLEALMEQIDNKENAKVSQTIQKRLHSNPNEMRRKEHLQLPDEYKWRVIVFDTETASFKPYGAIIDIGAVELINGKRTGRKFQAYIKPWARIHVEAMKVHGITEKFLQRNADGDIYQIMQSFMEWIHADCVCMQCQKLGAHELHRKHRLKLVGHNVVFDVRHLNGAIEYCQSKMNEEHKIWNTIDVEKDAFDTQTYFRNVLGNYGNYSLDGMCHKFGIPNDERKSAHGALIDAMQTAKCLQEMWKRDKDVKDRKCRNRFFVRKL